MKNVSTYVRSIYCPGFSAMMVWLFNTNLTLGFIPWKESTLGGFNQYDKTRFVSTTIDYEKASALYQIGKQIIDGTLTGECQYTIECNKQAKLIFEYKPNQRGQMNSYLTIDKNGERIAFEFCINFYYIKENGKAVMKIMHAGLGVFLHMLEGYLLSIGADRHLNKMTDEEIETLQTDAAI